VDPFDRHAIEVKVGETGINGRIRVAGQEPGLEALVIAGLDLAQQAGPGSGQRITPAAGPIEQQGRARISVQVLRMIGQIGEQQQRTGIVIERDQDQRYIRRGGVSPAKRVAKPAREVSRTRLRTLWPGVSSALPIAAASCALGSWSRWSASIQPSW
jgi:hypothetical protein